MRQSMILCCTLGAAIAVAGAVHAQGMPPLPTAGPEQAILKNDVGVWDATVEMMMGPQPMTSKGSETNTLMSNGLWLITDFKGDMMGTPFQGHGTSGWDSVKKKYVGNWVDSMSAGMSVFEGTYDPATKKITSWMEGPDMTGKVTKTKSVTEYVTPDKRVFSIYGPGPDGKEAVTMRITYIRHK